jgi:hypothetical protein
MTARDVGYQPRQKPPSPCRKPQDEREADWEYNQAAEAGRAFAALLEMMDRHDLARRVDCILADLR